MTNSQSDPARAVASGAAHGLSDAPGHSTHTYRPDIDGLRAFAVAFVVIYHAFPKAVPGGYIGVDIFFVISGFLITSILRKDISGGTFSLAAFYGRRIRRIFPALAVCLFATLAYGFVCLLPSELMQLGKHVFFGATFLSNIAIWSEAGYFEIAATLKPLLHLWSLGIEEQFYIIWPLALWAILRFEARAALWLVLLLVASFAINIWLSYTSIVGDFFLPVSRFWELLAGAGLAFGGPIALTRRVRSWLSVAGATGLLIAVTIFTADMRFPGWLALLPVCGAVALILSGPDAIVNRAILSNRLAVFVGLISYPLYLWHWPLISYAYIIRLGKPPTPLLGAALLALGVLLAWLTYRFIECPVRFGAHRSRHTLIVAASMAVLGAAGLATWATHGFPARFPALPGLDMRKISEARNDPFFQPTSGMVVRNQNGTLIARLGKGERKVAFGGDSVLFQFGPRVQALADEDALRANTYFVTGGSCAPVPGVVQQGDFAHCAELPAILFDLVRREKIETVVLGASWAGYGDAATRIGRDGARLPAETQDKDGRNAFYANLEDYVRRMQDQGASVFLVLGVPVHHTRFHPALMVERSVTGFKIAADVDKDVPVAELRRTYDGIDDRLREIVRRTGAGLLDALPDICGTGDGCSPFFASTEPKYSDGVHLRPSFVRTHVHFLDFLLK